MLLPTLAVLTAAATTATAITIAEIQGPAWVSPYNLQTVTNVTGVVTVVDVNIKAFYIQSLEPDNDPRTSEALFVFMAPQTELFNTLVYTNNVRPGTILNFAKGLVNETHATTGNTPYLNFQTTLQTVEDVSIVGTGPVPAPVRLGDKTFNYYYSESPYTLDSNADEQVRITVKNEALDLSRAHDYYESLESMYVEVADALVTSRSWNNFRQLPIVPNAGKGSLHINSNGGITMAKDSPQPVKFLLENPINIAFVAGQTTQPQLPPAVMGDILSTFTATLAWRYDGWHLRPASGPVTVTKVNPAVGLTSPLTRSDCNLIVGSYNIENFYASQNATRNALLAGHIATQLGSPDILFLQEVGDDDGPTKSDTVGSDKNLQALADAVVAAGGAQYAYTYVSPVREQD
ncbi:hypothetical protein HDU67_006711, partial [Dinochytrium kinnereticum]